MKRNIFEQKPVNIDDFNDSEEAEVKERIGERKKKKAWGSWKKQTAKKNRKVDENKRKEKDMWERLVKLNGEFKDIKKAKKETKRMSETIIN